MWSKGMVVRSKCKTVTDVSDDWWAKTFIAASETVIRVTMNTKDVD